MIYDVDMEKTPRGLRLHIGIFGKTNAGKSSLLNAITEQETAIVSEQRGTTTDPNQKAVELLPVGPVLFIDTAGLDDVSELGTQRIERTKKVLDKVDIALVVCDFNGINSFEKEIFAQLNKHNIPAITIINKTDIAGITAEKLNEIKKYCNNTTSLSAKSDDAAALIKHELIKILPEDFINPPKIAADLVKKGETVILVVPIDKEAPKGRLILPQVMTIRDLLDNSNIVIAVKENELSRALDSLKTPPSLVITDSQAFDEVSKIVPEEIALTSFSILFARLKGDFKTFLAGAQTLDTLADSSTIAVCESCTHHNIEDDIATVKIPKLVKKYTGKEIFFEYFKGADFPADTEKYKLIIHCGACMTNKREVLSRILKAKEKNIPITNYGMAIAKCLGILERAARPLML